MKLSAKIARLIRKKAKTTPPKPVREKIGKITPRRVVLLALCLLLAGGGTWAVLKFFSSNEFPPALIGRWEVLEGPMQGGTFDFSRDGTLEIRSLQGPLLQARVAVKGKNLLTTTKNPSTFRDETHKSVIQVLTQDSLVLELEKGDVLRLVRKR